MFNWISQVQSAFTSKVTGNSIKLKVCPYCHNDRWNFEISIDKGIFNCWACNCGKGKKIENFLQHYGIEYNPEDIQHNGESKKAYLDSVELPKNLRITNSNSVIASYAKRTLYSRGLTDEIIADFNLRIGLSEGWTNYIIFPFYNFNGLAAYIGAAISKCPLKYKIPEFLNKNVYAPRLRGSKNLVICEGVYDESTIYRYTDYDTLRLLGKHLFDKQIEMIKASNYEKVFMCLDGDALNSGIDNCRKLHHHSVNAYLVVLPSTLDPNDAGESIKDYIDNNSERYSIGLEFKVKKWQKQQIS